LLTLRDAAQYIHETAGSRARTAIECLMPVGDGGVPRIAMMQALLRDQPKAVKTPRRKSAKGIQDYPMSMMPKIRRGQIIGKQIGGPPLSEAEHFWKCEACGSYFDMRDLGAVLEHEEPLPHPAGDRAQ
jgi:hypothetical protein